MKYRYIAPEKDKMGINDDKGISIKLVGLVMLVVAVSICMRCEFQFVDAGETVMRCVDKEREALVTLKQGLIDDLGVLSSWGSEDHQRECCNWFGVTCSNTTGHVTTLILELGHFKGNISSVLVELHHLVRLDLSFNDFGGIGIPKFIGSMKSLQELDLYGSNFSGMIPPELGNLTNLRMLNVSSNKLWSKNLYWLSNLSWLSDLRLSYSNISDTNWVQHTLLQLPSLQSLEMRFCTLTFEGEIPKSLGKLIHLETLDLSNNQLSGSVPIGLGQLSNLSSLRLSNNNLQGTISEAHFIRLHNLDELDLSFNSLTLQLSPDWIPPFHLTYILLADCIVGPFFPKWLHTQWDFWALDLSSSGISDEIPKWFWNLSTSMIYFNLSHNQIRGTIPASMLIPSVIDISFNKFSGPLPSLSLYTEVIQLSQNMFSGSISSVCSINTDLMLLDLSNNQLAGTLPDCWENVTLLEVLNLSNNYLSSEIPPSLGSLSNLKSLHLGRNTLSGDLPSTLKNCKLLQLIDVRGNNLTGNVAQWLSEDLTSLKYLSLRGNRFYGAIPPQICKLTKLQMLDLSGNYLFGKIPPCFDSFTSLVDKSATTTSTVRFYVGYNDFIDYALVQWKGQESEYKNTLGLLKLIDLSSNNLIGNIPHEVSKLRGLISLNLSRNSLTGNIDQGIDEMEMLESLDLSRNHLSGEIPSGMARLSYLNVLDLAHNNLSGQIPLSTQLQSFNASAFEGNSKICGKPLKLCSERPPMIIVIEKDNDGFFSLSFMQEFGISMAFGFIVGFWGVVGSLCMKKSWRFAYFNFFGSIGDWLYVKAIIVSNKFRPKAVK